MSVILFAYKFHEVGCIQFISDLNIFRSNKERSHVHSKYLDKHSNELKIIQLHGFLSFSNIGQLFDIIVYNILIHNKIDDRQLHDVKKSTESSTYGYTHTGDDSIRYDAVHTALLKRSNSIAARYDVEEGDNRLENTSSDKPTLNVADEEGDLYDEDTEYLDTLDVINNHYYQTGNENNQLIDLSDHQKTKAIIISCNLLLGLDASAIDVIDQIILNCKQNNCKVVFCGLGTGRLRLLKKSNIFENHKNYLFYAKGINEAVTMMEDYILESADATSICDEINETDLEFKLQNQLITTEQYDEICFSNCLLEIQKKLSITIDLSALSKLSEYCIAATFNKGDRINLHLSNLLSNCGNNSNSPKNSFIHTVSSRMSLSNNKKLNSDRNLSKSVKGLYFLYKGFVVCHTNRKCNEKRGSGETLQSTINEYEQLQLTHNPDWDATTQHGPGNKHINNLYININTYIGWVFGRVREYGKITGDSPVPVGREKRIDNSQALMDHWIENTDLLLEGFIIAYLIPIWVGQHYIAETDVKVFFLSMESIEFLKKSNPHIIIALFELIASLLKEQLLRKKLQLSKLGDVMNFHRENYHVK